MWAWQKSTERGFFLIGLSFRFIEVITWSIPATIYALYDGFSPAFPGFILKHHLLTKVVGGKTTMCQTQGDAWGLYRDGKEQGN